MSMKEIILRDAKMCAYVAGNLEHFKYQMKRFGYVFKKDAWMAKPYFYSSDVRKLHRAKLSPFQKRFYAKLYRLRIVEQKRFVVVGAKYTEDLKRFHQLKDEYLLLVNNDIKDIVELVKFRSVQQKKMKQIDDRQHEIYKEIFSRKRKIKTDEQYREYQL